MCTPAPVCVLLSTNLAHMCAVWGGGVRERERERERVGGRLKAWCTEVGVGGGRSYFTTAGSGKGGGIDKGARSRERERGFPFWHNYAEFCMTYYCKCKNTVSLKLCAGVNHMLCIINYYPLPLPTNLYVCTDVNRTLNQQTSLCIDSLQATSVFMPVHIVIDFLL